MDSVDTAVVDAAPAVTPQVLGGEAQATAEPKKERLYMPDGRPAMLTKDGRLMPAGRPKGATSRVVRSIRDAVELASQPGQCHPKGLAGWLVERAQSRHAADRQIFAGLVGKALPLQVHAQHSGGIAIQLGWLQSRGIGATQADPAGSVTLEAREVDGQVVLEPTQLGDAQPEGRGMDGA